MKNFIKFILIIVTLVVFCYITISGIVDFFNIPVYKGPKEIIEIISVNFNESPIESTIMFIFSVLFGVVLSFFITALPWVIFESTYDKKEDFYEDLFNSKDNKRQKETIIN